MTTKTISIIIVVAILGLAGYFVFMKKSAMVIAPASAPTTAEHADITSSTATPTPRQNTAPLSDLERAFDLDKKDASAKIYYSEKLGVGFTYVPNASGTNFTIAVTETNNKLYVHKTTEAPETGQSIEVFEKDAALTLEEGLRAHFLTKSDPKNCFPKTLSTSLPNYAAAGISYPPSDDPNNPSKNSDKCPAYYTDSSIGSFIQFFLMNKNVPNKFVFVRIGQEFIITDGTNKNGVPYSWSHSIRILK